MRRLALASLLCTAAALSLAPPSASAAPGPSPTACAKLVKRFKVATTPKKAQKLARKGKPSVVGALWVPAAGGAPEHCRVTGHVETGDIASGQNRVGFELLLPTTWNDKLHFRGNGGFAGSVPALASGPFQRGYAVAGTDTGHQGTNEDASWAAASAAKRADFLDRGVHAAAQGVKQVIARYYRARSWRSYFEGCSTGGRQGLWQAIRYPADFDGVIAGAPADLEIVMASFAWNQQHMYPNPAQLGAPALPFDKLPALERAVLAACDALDGITDGILDDPRECAFDAIRDLPLCAPGNASDPNCFTAAQRGIVDAIYRGPGGVHRAPGYAKGGEGDPRNWKTWMVWSQLAADRPSLQHVLVDAFFRNFPAPGRDFRSFDAANGSFDLREPAGFAAAGDLRPYQQRGGKLLLWHGWADAAIPPLGTIASFDAIAASVGPTTRDDFARLYMAPGVFHCGGGPGPSSFDALGALEGWVERGQRPAAIVASGSGITRPLCPYPQRARRIDPSGSPTNAANFRCENP
jgi:feruloyl esterase